MTAFLFQYKATEDDGRELRYALRGLHKHWVGPTAEVYVVGDPLPTWAQRIEHFHVPQTSGKAYNMARNVLTGAQHLHDSGIDRAIYLSDDVVLLDFTDEIIPTYRATWQAHFEWIMSRRAEPDLDWLVRAAEATSAEVFPDALSFDNHRPLPIDTDVAVKTLEPIVQRDPRQAPLWRTVVGNAMVWPIEDEPVKARDIRADAHVPVGSKWASTDERFFDKSARLLDQLLPEPSLWEALS